MKAVNKGFTLIELMIVVAVIGVLAAIAIPQYQNYVAKSELAAAYSTVSALKVNYEDHITSNAASTVDASAINAPSIADGSVISADASSITYTFGPRTSAKIGEDSTLAISKLDDGGWSCAITINGDATSSIYPKGCN